MNTNKIVWLANCLCWKRQNSTHYKDKNLLQSFSNFSNLSKTLKKKVTMKEASGITNFHTYEWKIREKLDQYELYPMKLSNFFLKKKLRSIHLQKPYLIQNSSFFCLSCRLQIRIHNLRLIVKKL